MSNNEDLDLFEDFDFGDEEVATEKVVEKATEVPKEEVKVTTVEVENGAAEQFKIDLGEEPKKEKKNSKNKNNEEVEYLEDEDTKKKSKGKKKEEKKKYEGPREIIIYGDSIYVEEDPNVSLEEIKQKLVDTYGMKEFRMKGATLILDEETGIVTYDFQDFKNKSRG